MKIFVYDANAVARIYFPDIGTYNLKQIAGLPDKAILIPRLAQIESCSAFLEAVDQKHITQREYDFVKKRLNSDIARNILQVVELESNLGGRMMNYKKCRQKLLDISGLTDEKKLDEALPGRLKYDPRALQPLSFEGISVIHNIDSKTADDLRLSEMANQIISEVHKENLGTKVAFVNTESFHATTFDLINEKEHSEKLKRNGYDYLRIRNQVEEATIRFLKEIGLKLTATVRITGVGMFCPRVLKLDLQFHKVVSKVFQAYRLGLRRYLTRKVPGYSVIRGPNWNKRLAGHITFGYVVNPMTEPEINVFLRILKNFNRQFKSIEFELTQGEVTAFSDMDNYSVVSTSRTLGGLEV